MAAVNWKKAGTKNLNVSMKLLIICILLVRIIFTLLFVFFPGVLESARTGMSILVWPTIICPVVALYIAYRSTAKRQQKDFLYKAGIAPVMIAGPMLISLLISIVMWIAFFVFLSAFQRLETTVVTMRLWWIAVVSCEVLDHAFLLLLANALPPDKIAANRIK